MMVAMAEHDVAQDTSPSDEGGAGARPVLTVTPAAWSAIADAAAGEEDAATLALWVEVSGVGNGAYSYDVYFQSASDAGADDALEEGGALPVVVPAGSIDRLRGATLDWSAAGSPSEEGGLVILNPNTPPADREPAAPPTGDLSGELPQRVLRVLDEAINPQIASHGGRADLVALDEEAEDGVVAFLRLSGGCQGCGMARVTLSQGIEVMLRDAVPEIARIVDVTDHAGGNNPFYEPAAV